MSRGRDFESSRIQVLHVDDDTNFADLVKNRLEQETDRISVQTAAAPKEGLSVVAAETIDCIVSDYDMPTQNGVEFLQSVREEYPDLPFILYTSEGSEEIASEAISAGVTDYIQKEASSAHYTLLANRIQNSVSQFQAKKELARNEDLLAFTERLVKTGGWNFDIETGETRWTDGTYAIYGLEPDAELTKQEAIDFYHPDDRSEIKRLVERCIETGESYEATLRLIDTDDQLRWVRTNGEAIRENGDIVAIRGAIRDITELKKSEEHLKTAQKPTD
jgi:PAS domain S-box-containing protein